MEWIIRGGSRGERPSGQYLVPGTYNPFTPGRKIFVLLSGIFQQCAHQPVVPRTVVVCLVTQPSSPNLT